MRSHHIKTHSDLFEEKKGTPALQEYCHLFYLHCINAFINRDEVNKQILKAFNDAKMPLHLHTSAEQNYVWFQKVCRTLDLYQSNYSEKVVQYGGHDESQAKEKDEEKEGRR